MGGALVQHLRIAAELARVGLVRKSQFRVEFWCQVLMDCIWYASHVAVFEILYSHVTDIAGWGREDFRVLLGFLFVSDAFMMIWMSQMWRFGRDLKDGKLDPFRLRPVSCLFLYSFQHFSPEGCVNMAVALGYLAFGVHRAAGPSGLAAMLLTMLGIALACWARFAMLTFFSLFEFLVVGSDASRFTSELFQSATDRPLDIFGARIRLFLIYIVPVGALTQVPASLVLGHYSLLEGAATVTWLAAFGVLVAGAWNRGFRRYESAMG